MMGKAEAVNEEARLKLDLVAINRSAEIHLMKSVVKTDFGKRSVQ